MNILPDKLTKRPFSYKEARDCGVSHYFLRRLIENGEIIKISRGLYSVVGLDYGDENIFEVATKSVGSQSCVCLLSALSFYDLTDVIPKKTWLMVEASKRTSLPHIRLYRARDPKWNIGIIDKGRYSITSIERTIVDGMTHTKLMPAKIGIDAMMLAISSQKSSASKILDMSNKLGVKNRIIKYLEVLS